MTPEQWQQARQHFEAALALTREERTAYLTRICATDPQMHREVERLLAAASQANSFIEQPAISFAPAPQRATDLTGQQLGAYRVLRALGQGGMGAVWLAERADGAFQKQVALKLVRPGITEDELQRFLQERQILADLDHPNIARLLDGGTWEGLPYLVMEYVEGQSLRERLMSGALPLEQAVAITEQICAGLAAAHAAGIVHRDIKPENIIVTTHNGALKSKILDFGIAKLHAANSTHTQTGTLIGTASYMSPEQAAGLTAEQIDARADIYSVGLLLYEMLTGQPTFAGDSYLQVLHKQLHETPIPPRRRHPDGKIPPAVEAVILKALHKQREQRQQTAEALSQELQRALQQPNASRANRWKPIVALVACALLLVVAIKWWSSLRPQQEAMPAITSAATLQYRIQRRNPAGQVEWLKPDAAVNAGDAISFAFHASFASAVYLLYEHRDGSLTWANPQANGAAQTVRPGEWLCAPHCDGLKLDAQAGAQNFLVLHVPTTHDWSLPNALAPEPLPIKEGVIQYAPNRRALLRHARLSLPASQRLLALLRAQAISATFTATPDSSHELKLPAAAQMVFHRITLQQSAP
jgi:serine/threonine protein kinase